MLDFEMVEKPAKKMTPIKSKPIKMIQSGAIEKTTRLGSKEIASKNMQTKSDYFNNFDS